MQRLNLTRDQLATFLQDHEQIKQFENLFAVVDAIAPDLVEQLNVTAGTAVSKANNALAQVANIGDAVDFISLKSTRPDIAKNYQDFDVNPAYASEKGRLGWNTQHQTLNLGMDYSVIQNIGLDTYARVQNSTGATIPKGSVVGFVGVGTANTLKVSKYIANGTSPSLYILGVLAHDLPDSGQVGYCTTWGHVKNIDTSAFTIGDVLYASPTVAGAFTNVKPTVPNNVIPLAAVLKVGVSDGEIFVRPTIEQQSYYGKIIKTSDQSPAAANTAYAITMDSVVIGNGVVIGTPSSRIVVPESGLYDVSVNYQITSTSASDKDVYFWFSVNGVNVPNSTSAITLSKNNEFKQVSKSDFFSLNKNDYIELMWASNSTNITLDSIPAPLFAPVTPSVTVCVKQIQQ